MKFAVGSKNPTKINCAKIVGDRLFDTVEVIGVSVASNVADQPMSDAESIQGAINRAHAALNAIEDSMYGIGMEGGMHRIGDRVFESGWIAVVDRHGGVGLGSSARFEMSKKMLARIEQGIELGQVIDEITGREGVAKEEGCMGLITCGHLPRTDAYTHGLLFAFAPFISDKSLWV